MSIEFKIHPLLAALAINVLELCLLVWWVDQYQAENTKCSQGIIISQGFI